MINIFFPLHSSKFNRNEKLPKKKERFFLYKRYKMNMNAKLKLKTKSEEKLLNSE